MASRNDKKIIYSQKISSKTSIRKKNCNLALEWFTSNRSLTLVINLLLYLLIKGKSLNIYDENVDIPNFEDLLPGVSSDALKFS